MKPVICILPEHRGVGGPASFRARILAGLAERGIETVTDPREEKITAILVIGGTRRLDQLFQAHRRGLRIVQRLNGINWVHRKTRTGLRHSLRAEINNCILAAIRARLADQIVYQSAFTKAWWEQIYGKIPCPDSIIHNGVDLQIFSPASKSGLPSDRTRILVVEGHFGGGYEVGLENAVRFSNTLQQKTGTPVELVLAGNAEPSLRDKYHGMDWIEWKGIISRQELPALYRSAHLLFSADINASCPNAVIEALACGLPVAGYDTGSLRELVEPGGGVVCSYGTDPQKLEPADPAPLAESACRMLANRSVFSQAARRRAKSAFDVREMVGKYLEALT